MIAYATVEIPVTKMMKLWTRSMLKRILMVEFSSLRKVFSTIEEQIVIINPVLGPVSIKTLSTKVCPSNMYTELEFVVLLSIFYAMLSALIPKSN